MARTGRPKIEIDQKHFEQLCGLQCTLDEIAFWFKCSEDTIERWCKRTYDGATFADTYKKHSAFGKISLRRYQFALAKKSATMCIWLGKQMLGQKDINVMRMTGENGGAIEVNNTPAIDLSTLSKEDVLKLTREAFTHDDQD